MASIKMVRSLLPFDILNADSISSLIVKNAFEQGITLCGLRPYILLRTFNVDIALGQLKNIKDEKSGNQKEKFSVKNIAIMKSILTDAPEKWNSIHALAKKDYISGNSVVTFAMQNTEKLDTIKDYLTLLFNYYNCHVENKEMVAICDKLKNYQYAYG